MSSLPPNLYCSSSSAAVDDDLSPPERLDAANTFEVAVVRNAGGLGLSVCGGPGARPPWAGLIRVRRVFPLQPAWQTGRVAAGDVLVAVAGKPLTGLPLTRALDELRRAGGGAPGAEVVLRLHRPGVDRLDNNAALKQTLDRSRSFTPSTAHSPLGLSLNLSLPLEGSNNNPEVKAVPYGPISVDLVKVNGSLGFSLCRSSSSSEHAESSPLRHTVKALSREPAASDGRIRPGDKLVEANGVSLAPMSHEEVIRFLRACPDRVSLLLYRDDSRSQTPVSPEDEDEPARELKRPSHFLRFEAREMVRSLQASRSSLDRMSPQSCTSIGSGKLRRGFSPHRHHQHQQQPQPASLSIFQSSGEACEEPTVETPETPLAEDYRSLPAALDECLRIEEVDDDDDDVDNVDPAM